MDHTKLDQLITVAKEYKSKKIDTSVSSEAMVIGGTDGSPEHYDKFYTKQPGLFGTEAPRPLTVTAAKQLAKIQDWSAAARFVENDLLPNLPGRFGDLVNGFAAIDGYGLTKKGRMKNLLFREIEPIEGFYQEKTVRSVKGGQYVPYDAADVLKQYRDTFQLLEDGDVVKTILAGVRNHYGQNADIEIDSSKPLYTMTKGYLTPDKFDIAFKLNVWVNPHDGKGGNSAFNPGVTTKSDDVGNTSLMTFPYTHTLICTNGATIRMGRSDMKDGANWNPTIWHIGSHKKIQQQLQDAIYGALFVGLELVDKMIDAQLMELREPAAITSAVLKSILPKEKFDDAMLNVGLGSGGGHTFYDAVQGLTYAAHATKSLDIDERFVLESAAGTAMYRIDDARDSRGNVTDDTVTNLFAKIIPAMALVEEAS